ncbi:c-type cytochrome [Aestuariivirga sp.]|jgi:mono/diheme cytochrome c family protein|uniref:c-type cytochrome n=1 Tax=Aestuariivirga sp. TaxID=2650926 RepID=UPI003784CA13
MVGMKRVALVVLVLAIAGAAGAWWFSVPQPLALSSLPSHVPDAANGQVLYNAAGCFSCHRPGPEMAAADQALPSGGAPLKTPVGVFYPPNLTPDPETGLGKWTDLDFVNAVQRGLSPEGQHLIPAFPYTSYAHMKTEDVLDIRAYLATLTPVVSPEKPAEIPAPWLLRRGVGLWKHLGLDTTPWQPDPAQTASWNRGAYIANAPGHCNECHTPRNIVMVPDMSRQFAGGLHPEGQGRVPSLRDLLGRGKYKDAADLTLAFQNGEMLGYENMSSGGMGAVQTNLSKLPQADVEALAEYIVSLK